MNDLAVPSGRQLSLHALEGVANRIDAARRLLQCTRWLQHRDHRPICDVAVRHLGVYVEAIRLAHGRLADKPVSPSQALASDVATALPWQPLGSLGAEDLIDAYVNGRLVGVVAAIRVVESACLEGDDPGRQEVGNAMFECLHWIETARRDLAELAGQGIEDRKAA